MRRHDTSKRLAAAGLLVSRKTIRKVTIVVPVFITSCQVSEKRNNGPVNPQTIITDSARMKDIDVPVAFVAWSEKRSRIWLSLLLSLAP
jgi:hypothetical protein